MQLKVSYEEIQNLVFQKAGKNITLSTINQTTVNVGYEHHFNLFGERTIPLQVPVHINRITGSDVYLTLLGKVETLAKGLLLFIDTSSVVEKADDGFVIHLKEIPQLSTAIDKIEIQNLTFADGGTTVEFGLTL